MAGLFPRGLGNLEEVPQEYVMRCIDRAMQLEKDRDGVQKTLFLKALDIVATSEIG